MQSPIIIVGMARSGTTLVSHLLGRVPNVYCEIEPHILWKAGSFAHLGDDKFTYNPSVIKWIRNQLFLNAQGKTLVEKSPPNCIRPELVHSVFPEAKIVYVERDPIRCISSNYRRSISRDSLKPSIIIKKYFMFSGSVDLPGAIGKRKVYQQLRYNDLMQFLFYFIRMFFIRNFLRRLPFGPKLTRYSRYIKEHGLLKYHVKVYIEASKYKKIYKSLYGDNMKTFNLEDIQCNLESVRKLYDFCNLDATEESISDAMKVASDKRVAASMEQGPWDFEIKQLLAELGNHN